MFISGNYILTYLVTRMKLDAYVIQSLATLFARITKLGWFDMEKEEFVFRNVIGDVTTFLQVSY
jgi:exportin-7